MPGLAMRYGRSILGSVGYLMGKSITTYGINGHGILMLRVGWMCDTVMDNFGGDGDWLGQHLHRTSFRGYTIHSDSLLSSHSIMRGNHRSQYILLL